jgi:hypothetical protein
MLLRHPFLKRRNWPWKDSNWFVQMQVICSKKGVICTSIDVLTPFSRYFYVLFDVALCLLKLPIICRCRLLQAMFLLYLKQFRTDKDFKKLTFLFLESSDDLLFQCLMESVPEFLLRHHLYPNLVPILLQVVRSIFKTKFPVLYINLLLFSLTCFILESFVRFSQRSSKDPPYCSSNTTRQEEV